MAHIAPVAEDDLPDEIRPILEMARARMGFLPNSLPTMAHWPDLLKVFSPMAVTILRSGELDVGLKQMIAAVTSAAAGCRYCQAHTSHGAAHAGGVDSEKVVRVWEYQQSDLFSDAERAALDLALAAGQVPNAASDAHFSALRRHFSEREIVEIVAVISLFGFLNRWNDTMATALEDEPAAFAAATYAPDQWDLGKHGA
ncbi:peroxidase-related enzyme [Altererythrobacter arenosus]|uniref:Peroxidase-related enzyme n=1 Tax=Altererythrobacter arenosus TaxID=3032592 RepID=A0ABY8FSX6_9SPHN|nr:peroxidase-related enzyme [Altererythrobacter sp. CAU 1644]WFL76531.1 peroxidase-related enzyme [Altererythrobacter sp. CAU 1644]